jgi:hypothetical protein
LQINDDAHDIPCSQKSVIFPAQGVRLKVVAAHHTLDSPNGALPAAASWEKTFVAPVFEKRCDSGTARNDSCTNAARRNAPLGLHDLEAMFPPADAGVIEIASLRDASHAPVMNDCWITPSAHPTYPTYETTLPRASQWRGWR